MSETTPRPTSPARKTVLALAALLVAGLLAVGCSKSAPPPETAADLDKLGAPAQTQPVAQKAPDTGDDNQADHHAGHDQGASAEQKVIVPVYFGFDSHTLDQEALAEVTELGRFLRDQRPEVALTIEGHADERGSVEYNIALGEQRARSTRKALERLGVEAERLRTVSYGESKPAVQGKGESAWSRNRRAEFVTR